MSTTSIFFNQAFDKKRLKAFLYWVLKTFGEKEGLIVVEQLKSMGFYNATKAGLSIGLHDLKTPYKKKLLISEAQATMRKNDQEFQGAELTATERSQRIVDTWHRTSEDLRKQVVDYFSTYDQLNSVYMMALSGARGNFSQVRQLIGMRGLMADPQGQIISFPIRSNLREGLTLTEYFISCSGARKGLVDTALRTADTGYLTRRLVDISHHIVVKRVSCYTSRGIALKTLRTPQKVLLSLRDRLVGRVLAENIYSEKGMTFASEVAENNQISPGSIDTKQRTRLNEILKQSEKSNQIKTILARKNQEISPDLAFQISLLKENCFGEDEGTIKTSLTQKQLQKQSFCISSAHTIPHKRSLSKEGSSIRNSTSPSVLVRSPLTCTYTHELCQLCYGWSMAQGSLVSLGEAVGVIAGQSIGEPGTQLTMRTFHTGGVFSGDLLQEIRSPHSGKILFPKALQGLLIRTSQGRIAFLVKVSGELLVENSYAENSVDPSKTTRVPLAPSTILFVRQGEKVKSHQLLAELAIATEEGNQPIKSRQTLFSEIGGRILQWKNMTAKVHRTKGTLPKQKEGDSLRSNSCKSLYAKTNSLQSTFFEQNKNTNNPVSREEQVYRIGSNSNVSYYQAGSTSSEKKADILIKPSIQAYLGPVEATRNSFYSELDQSTLDNETDLLGCSLIFSQEENKEEKTRKKKYNLVKNLSLQRVVDQRGQEYEERWGYGNNVTLKKMTLAKRHGLGSIEPVQALKLGLLGVIATRVGSSERRCICKNKLFTRKVSFLNKEDIVSSALKKISRKAIDANTLSSATTLQDQILKEQPFVKKRNPRLICSDTNHTCYLHLLKNVAKEGDLVNEDYNQF